MNLWMHRCLLVAGFLCAGCATSPDTITSREIDAAASLSFDDAKSSALLAVAQRPTLSDAEQVYLVHTSVHRLSFDADRSRVLKAIIHNPSFSSPAKKAILEDLRWLSFDDDKASLLREMNDRPGKISTTRQALDEK